MTGNVAAAKKSGSENNWRVQIGAFSGQSAAEAALKRARERVPDMASLKPKYEPVPGKPSLVRLQLALADDRDGGRLIYGDDVPDEELVSR